MKKYGKYLFLCLSILLVVFALVSIRKNKKCISGDCENGFGTAIYLNGDLNNAGFKDILGLNIYDWDDNNRYSDVYIGNFKNGKRINGICLHNRWVLQGLGNGNWISGKFSAKDLPNSYNKLHKGFQLDEFDKRSSEIIDYFLDEGNINKNGYFIENQKRNKTVIYYLKKYNRTSNKVLKDINSKLSELIHRGKLSNLVIENEKKAYLLECQTECQRLKLNLSVLWDDTSKQKYLTECYSKLSKPFCECSLDKITNRFISASFAIEDEDQFAEIYMSCK